jgi:hypothetical protein
LAQPLTIKEFKKIFIVMGAMVVVIFLNNWAGENLN